MSARLKNILYSLLLLVVIWCVWWYRKQDVSQPIRIEGETMGTTYHVIYFDEQQRNFVTHIDSLLQQINGSLSTYLPHSEISKYNKGQSVYYDDVHLYTMLQQSSFIVKASEGAFDPTVMPLVNAWGFGPDQPLNNVEDKIDSIRSFVGFDKVLFNADSVWKTDDRVQLDFSAIAKGYGVDKIVALIKNSGVHHLMVEIGGEVRVLGNNLATGKPWKVGILDPTKRKQRGYIAYANLVDKAIATSGNYFNYYEKNNKKYIHSINPVSGLAQPTDLLSVSVFANDCATADAWATAFMVMGRRVAINLLKKQNQLDALLIYSTDTTITIFATERIKKLLNMNP